jgi:hypothetical protein
VSGFAVASEVNVSDTEGDEVVVYPVIAEPLIAPAVYGIETVVALELVAVPRVGAAATEYGVTLALPEAALVPVAFAAVTETE